MYQHKSMEPTQISKPEVITPPSLEPLTLEEAKKQNFVASSDSNHDTELLNVIQAAREQWENDTDSAVLTQSLRVTSERFSGRSIKLSRRPLSSVTSVTYYDDLNVLRTLSTSVYSVNKQAEEIRLTWNESWPTTAIRWDAVTVDYVVGYADRSSVPLIAKQAMLLLVNYYFDANKGDNDRQYDQRAYERLVARYMRSSYP